MAVANGCARHERCSRDLAAVTASGNARARSEKHHDHSRPAHVMSFFDTAPARQAPPRR